MPQARPVGPAPTTTTSNCSTFTALLSTLARRLGFERRAAAAARIFAAAFGHVGPAAAFAADGLRDRAGQLAGVHFRRQILGDARRRWRRSNRSTEASTTTALFHLLRSESTSVRSCWRSMPVDARRRAP